jgi:hypothetical protein
MSWISFDDGEEVKGKQNKIVDRGHYTPRILAF